MKQNVLGRFPEGKVKYTRFAVYWNIVRLSVQKIQMIDKKYFICEICGKVFTPASNLASILSPPWEEINWPQLVSIVAPV